MNGETLLELGTATLGECGASRLAAPPPPMWPGVSVAGRAFPVHCTGGDNLAIHVGVANAGADDVLVVDVEGVYGFGYWGEVLTVAAQARGVAGLVIDGCIRDVDAIERRRFPAFAARHCAARRQQVTARPNRSSTAVGRGRDRRAATGSSPIVTAWSS